MPDTSGAVTATDMLININSVGRTFTSQDGEQIVALDMVGSRLV